MNIDNQKIHEYFYNEEEEENIQKVSVGGPGAIGIVFNLIILGIFFYMLFKINENSPLSNLRKREIILIVLAFFFIIVGFSLSIAILTNKSKNNIAVISFVSGIFTGINIFIPLVMYKQKNNSSNNSPPSNTSNK